jgi:hypothetical protein
VPHKKCEACLRQSNSQRAQRRAQDPKPRGQPPKKSNRGRKPKRDLRDRFGDSLHITAQVSVAEKGNDGDELAAQPPVPPPATRPRGRPRGRAWGPPPTQRPNAGHRKAAEPSPELPTRLSTRHARRGSKLAPPPKRLKPPHDVILSSNLLGPSSQPHPIEFMDIPPNSADPLHGGGNTYSSTSRDATSASPYSTGLLLRQFLTPTAVQHSVTERNEFTSTTSSNQPSINTILNRFAPYISPRALRKGEG